jgi:hypothetical protein
MPIQKSNFWLNPEFEPKRQFRYLIELTIGGQNLQFLAKSVDRPSYTIESNPHQFFNHTFHYPGRVTWNSISLTLVDPVSPNGAAILYEYLSSIGIEKPTSVNAAIGSTITKESASSALGNLVIKEMGTRPGSPETVVVGNWQFLNAFLTRCELWLSGHMSPKRWLILALMFNTIGQSTSAAMSKRVAPDFF